MISSWLSHPSFPHCQPCWLHFSLFFQPGDHARLLFLSVCFSFPFRTFSLINLIQHVKNRSIHLSVSVSLQWLQLIGLLIQVKYTFLKACTQTLPYQLSCGKQCFVCVCKTVCFTHTRSCVYLCLSGFFLLKGENFITWPWNEWSMHMFSVQHTHISTHVNTQNTHHVTHVHTLTHKHSPHVVHIMSLGCSDGQKNNWILRD